MMLLWFLQANSRLRDLPSTCWILAAINESETPFAPNFSSGRRSNRRSDVCGNLLLDLFHWSLHKWRKTASECREDKLGVQCSWILAILLAEDFFLRCPQLSCWPEFLHDSSSVISRRTPLYQPFPIAECFRQLSIFASLRCSIVFVALKRANPPLSTSGIYSLPDSFCQTSTSDKTGCDIHPVYVHLTISHFEQLWRWLQYNVKKRKTRTRNKDRLQLAAVSFILHTSAVVKGLIF